MYWQNIIQYFELADDIFYASLNELTDGRRQDTHHNDKDASQSVLVNASLSCFYHWRLVHIVHTQKNFPNHETVYVVQGLFFCKFGMDTGCKNKWISDFYFDAMPCETATVHMWNM